MRNSCDICGTWILKYFLYLFINLFIWFILFFSESNVTDELLVIVEFCRYGSLQKYLRNHRLSYVNQVDEQGYIDPSINVEQLTKDEMQWVDM